MAYDEPLLDVEDHPEPLPMNWYKIARKANRVRKSTLYEDPMIRKKLVKRVGKGGDSSWFLILISNETEEKLLEKNMGPNRPTEKEMMVINPNQLIIEDKLKQ